MVFGGWKWKWPHPKPFFFLKLDIVLKVFKSWICRVSSILPWCVPLNSVHPYPPQGAPPAHCCHPSRRTRRAAAAAWLKSLGGFPAAKVGSERGRDPNILGFFKTYNYNPLQNWPNQQCVKIFVLIWGGQGCLWYGLLVAWGSLGKNQSQKKILETNMPGYLPKYPQTNLEKIETDEQLTVGKHQNIWRSGWMWINFKANTVTPHGRRQIPPGLSFFFLLVFWVGERCGMVLPNVDNWKLSSAKRNILLLFASSCLRSPVNWGFRTENQQQKGHVRGLKNRSGNDVTIWYIRNSYHISVFVCISTYIYIYQHPHLYLDILYPSIYIPIYNRSPFRSSSQIWSKALATETKPERLERLDVSPWSTKRFNDDPLNPVKTVQMFVKHPVMIKGINSYMNNLWGDFASPFWTATFEQVANVPSCTTGTKMQMVSH